ncbi:hypothetical protein ERJ75_000010000 [Trypanosoma vivax]|nr:hypothetical protein ERJ75_000010000 [Trypanosoma vivax]
MLGVGTWFIGLGVPVVLTTAFVASRRRLAYQWREELMDLEGSAYPVMSVADMEFLRRVLLPHQTKNADGRMAVKDNIGLRVDGEFLTTEECQVLLDEVKRLVPLLGQPVDTRKASVVQSQAKAEGVDISFYSDVSIISDHAEDIQLMKAPWGTGDRIKYEHIPASLRYLVSKVQRQFMGVGRLRHVYVEYSPSGKFYHEPRATKAFDGHDYVIVPLRRDKRATVVTYSPLLRSRFSFAREVLESSWTSRDIDAFVPSGGVIRTYGPARYEWGWGIRPGEVWFGNSHNLLRAVEKTSASSFGLSYLMGGFRKLFSTTSVVENANHEAALVVLHFDGPRSKNKKRSLLSPGVPDIRQTTDAENVRAVGG